MTTRWQYSISVAMITGWVHAPLNATKIAVMKVSHHGVVTVGPELLFSIYKWFFFARDRATKWLRAELTVAQPTALLTGGGATERVPWT